VKEYNQKYYYYHFELKKSFKKEKKLLIIWGDPIFLVLMSSERAEFIDTWWGEKLTQSQVRQVNIRKPWSFFCADSTYIIISGYYIHNITAKCGTFEKRINSFTSFSAGSRFNCKF